MIYRGKNSSEKCILLFALFCVAIPAFATDDCTRTFRELGRDANFLMKLLLRPTPAELESKFKARWAALDIKRQRYDWKMLLEMKSSDPDWDIVNSAMEKVRSYQNQISDTTGGRNKESQAVALKNSEQADALIRKWMVNKEPLTLEKIKLLHSTLGNGLRNNGFPAGQFRKIELINDKNARKVYQYPDWQAVEPMMNDFMAWYHRAQGDPPIEIAGRAYQRLVSIHPFADGNGRLSRAVMDWILQSNGYPPAVFFDKRSSYTTLYFERTENENFAPERAVEVATLGVENAYAILDLVFSKTPKNSHARSGNMHIETK